MFKAFLMSIFSFWRMELPPEALNFGNRLEIIVYEKGSQSSTEFVDQTDPKYRSIMEFLAANKKNWKQDTSSYAPDILVKGNGITLNCRKGNAIIYYTHNEKESLQFSSDTTSVSCCGLNQ